MNPLAISDEEPAGDPKLAELSRYLERCAATLQDVREELALSSPGFKSDASLQRACGLLSELSFDADGWGFDCLCEVASGLQHVLLAYRNNNWNLHSAEVVVDALEMISSIVGQCEEEYRRRMAVSHLLDSFERAAASA